MGGCRVPHTVLANRMKGVQSCRKDGPTICVNLFMDIGISRSRQEAMLKPATKQTGFNFYAQCNLANQRNNFQKK